MHPDTFLVLYRQQERELTQQREIQRAQAARTGGRARGVPRPHPFTVLAAGRRHAG